MGHRSWYGPYRMAPMIAVLRILSWGRIFSRVFHQSNQLAILRHQWTRHPLEKWTGDQIDQNAPTLEPLSSWKYSHHRTTLVANIREAIDLVSADSFPNALEASSTREKKNKRFQIHFLKTCKWIKLRGTKVDGPCMDGETKGTHSKEGGVDPHTMVICIKLNGPIGE